MPTENLTIKCPACFYSRTIPESAIPPGAAKATCPGCGTRFDLADAISRSLDTAENPATPTAPPLSEPEVMESRVHMLRFSGSAREYFGIWIVNTFLKIVSFGIYSAWAKVRKRRYFMGCTTLDNAPFDYIADPKLLFKGWLIGVAAFICYSVAGQIDPMLALVVGLGLFVAIPWVIVRSRMFNNRNTSYRNLVFSFAPNYREAYTVYAGLPLLSIFTLGIITPYILWRQQKFHVENSAYGSTRFSFDAKILDFYKVFLWGMFWFILIGVLVTGVIAAVLFGSGSMGNPRQMQMLAVPYFMLAYFGMIFFYLLFAVYMKVRLGNISWNGTTLGGNRFTSSLRFRDMLWIYTSNLAAIIFSFGLMTPWAAIRLSRYRCEKMGLVVNGSLESFVAGSRHPDTNAVGEEIGDIFDVQMDFGL